MEKATLGSALLAGDERSRSQVNSILLGLMGSAATSHDSTAVGETRRSRSGKRSRSRSQHTATTARDEKKKKRRRKEPRDHHRATTISPHTTTRQDHDHDDNDAPSEPNKARRTVSLDGGVDKYKSAGSRGHASAPARRGSTTRRCNAAARIERVAEDEEEEPECIESIELEGVEEEEEEEEEGEVKIGEPVRRTASSEEVTIPMLAMADVYDYFDYHYYPQSPATTTTTPLASPHLRSTPSSPFPSPLIPVSSSPRRSSIQLPSSFSYAAQPSTTAVPVPLALSLSSFAMPYPYYQPQPQLDSAWALPSRPVLPTLDYCTQLLM